jgi:hypothetical protein
MAMNKLTDQNKSLSVIQRCRQVCWAIVMPYFEGKIGSNLRIVLTTNPLLLPGCIFSTLERQTRSTFLLELIEFSGLDTLNVFFVQLKN